MQILDSSQYIIHHLEHFSNKYQNSIIDFHIINIDTILVSVICAIIISIILIYAQKNITYKKPNRIQCIIEIIIEMIIKQTKNATKKNNNFLAPLSFTLFTWIVLMNSLDLIPVDLPNYIINLLNLSNSIKHFKIVPTSDLNCTLGMSFGISLLIMYYNLKNKGIKKFVQYILTTPFGKNIIFWLPNLLLNTVEFIAKIISLGMRLFGNMYSGELIFLLISLLGGIYTSKKKITILGIFGHIITGSIWSIFHILIIILQSFIFMMLTISYISQTYEKH